MGAFESVQAPVKQPSVVLAVVAGVATVYAFWELRIRASKKQGLIPQTMSKARQHHFNKGHRPRRWSCLPLFSLSSSNTCPRHAGVAGGGARVPPARSFPVKPPQVCTPQPTQVRIGSLSAQRAAQRCCSAGVKLACMA
ncbi:hypothetical protein ACK3TF_003508 [Chlorella vulgaris]